ncbi:MAG TPA: protein kinase [Gemmatimonadales bacterium]|nr:protein kinase [Gemmatimonadales bacterium]
MPDLQAQLQEGLSGSYAIERELGHGGMATVFLARDLTHGRLVALKVLHAHLAETLGPERFQREIHTAARLQHPHILTVLDSGNAGGRLWFTMPYIDGESVRNRLTRERQLPVDDALRIAIEAAQALQYAHDQGVVHRDIKPENLLLTRDGNTLVADFGIARGLSTGDEAKLTETGLVVGTPAYMSPEQAGGDAALDARTDIYSLGVVLYEMLAGEAPYTGPTVQALLVKRLTQAPPSARAARPQLPEAADAAIRRALAPVPADRFATMAQFGQALRQATAPPASTSVPSTATPATVAVPKSEPKPRSRRTPVLASTLVLGILIGLGVLFAWRRSHAGSGNDSATKIIAVLPFQNLGDSSTAYFADGITDAVRGKLSSVPGLQVIASQSSSEYRGSRKSLTEIARELDADYLLVARVRWAQGADGSRRVEVSPELEQAEPGRPPTTKWQQPFEASVTDVFQVQSEIASKVASALDVALGSEQRQAITEKPTANLAAYEAFLRGERIAGSVGSSGPPELRSAIAYYEQAVALDSTFAQAWAQLSRARTYLYYASSPDLALGEAGRVAAERANALGTHRAEAQLALGDYRLNIRGDGPGALTAYQAGLQVAPHDADLLTGAALAEQTIGRWDAALEHLRVARELDPRSVATARRYDATLIRLRRLPEARSAAEQSMALAPENLDLLENVIMTYLAAGDLAGARAAVRDRGSRVQPTDLVAYLANYWDLFWVLDDEQQRLVLRLPPSAFDGERGTWGIVLAQTYWVRGDHARARAYADSSLAAQQELLRQNPEDSQRHAFATLALAMLGRKAEALREGERTLALTPVASDGYTGPYNQHVVARSYVLLGESEKALDLLEPLLQMPYFLTPGWLRIDPAWDSLRSNPRFKKLTESTT